MTHDEIMAKARSAVVEWGFRGHNEECVTPDGGTDCQCWYAATLDRALELAEAWGAVEARVPCINVRAGAPCFWPLVQGVLVPADWWCVPCVKARAVQARYDAAVREVIEHE